jgi:hypothetical protein
LEKDYVCFSIAARGLFSVMPDLIRHPEFSEKWIPIFSE